MAYYDKIIENDKNGKYTTKLPYPYSCMEMSDELRKEMKDAYYKDKMLKSEIFKDDLLSWAASRFGEITDKQFSAIYNKAYDDGHSSGHSEVAIYFQDLLDIIEEFVKK